MIVVFDKSFEKSLDKINDKVLLNKIEKVIIQTEKAYSIQEITNLKKLKGFKNFFRIKIGDYRIGVEIIENQVRFIIILHRKDIYKTFP